MMSNPHRPDDNDPVVPSTHDHRPAANRVGVAPSGLMQRLGDFRLIREVGRGGMGIVYEAEQVSLGRRVAVKVLRFGSGPNLEAVDRFRREAETIARLHHTNIVPIFFVGGEEGVDYYAMQFIDGQSLASVLAEEGGSVEPRKVIAWGLQVAEALHHAHQRGVIHRDIKPSNLLLGGDDRIWLTDFGLAKRADDVTLSMTGTILGTPRYMSPEQASAARHQLDHRTDIYSLGATLYELITGRPVFSAETPHQVVAKILHEDPTPPRQLVSSLPRDVETILLKCLQKEPENRYESAQALADDLRAVLDDRPVRARRSNPAERIRKWLRRHHLALRLSAASVAITISLVGLLLIAIFWFRQRQLAYVTLETDQPPLVAEIRKAAGTIVTRQTVPTEQPLQIPAGRYTMRVSGERRLSETYDVRLDRQDSRLFEVDLDTSLLMAPIETEKSYQLVSADARTLAIVLDRDGLRCWDLRHAQLRWTKSLRDPNDRAFAEAPGWSWPWYPLVGSYQGWGVHDLRPFLVSPAADLNGDDIGDIVLAARHQACLVALSGADGHVLWVAPRGHDLLRPIENTQARLQQGVVSAIVATPTPVGDQNGDGIADYLVVAADASGGETPLDRWIELVSGKSGQTVWRQEIGGQWFVSPANQNVPEQFRWFWGSGAATSTAGGTHHSVGNQVVRRSRARLERTGYFHHVPGSVLTLSWRPNSEEPPRASVLAGSHLLAFNQKTGHPVGDPLDCTLMPVRPPLVADLDSDGAHELVLMQELPANSGAPAGSSQVRMVGVSLASRRVLWVRSLAASWPHTEQFGLPPPQWPLAADLDNDRRLELIVPDGSSQSAFRMDEAWGELEVLDGISGKTRWRHRLKTMDQQVDHFLAGPDVDGDGINDVFVATLWSPAVDLYVDALSGKDGRSIWVGHETLRQINETAWFHLAPPLWWNAGLDGWPQLVVAVHPGENTQAGPLVRMFSAGTGKTTRTGGNLIEFQPADGDGDGIEDLFAFTSHNEQALDQGGTLVGFRGQSRELWQTLGDPWSPTVDLDGDDACDLVRPMADGSLTAASSRDGRTLWTTPRLFTGLVTSNVIAAVPHQYGPTQPGRLAESPPLGASVFGQDGRSQPEGGNRSKAADLNQDGTPDLLAYTSGIHPIPYSPLCAVSGRNGQKLWEAKIELRGVDKVFALDCRDLDGDGLAEVIWVASGDWGSTDASVAGTQKSQLMLVVLSGRSGRVLWKASLTKAYGFAPLPGSLPYQFNPGSLAISCGDLDGDGTQELIVPAESDADPTQPQLELRAFSGKTGKVVWIRPLPPPRDIPQAFSDLPPPAVTDLDGDGRLDLVLLTFEKPANTSGTLAVLRALQGHDGSERWSCRFDVADSCGKLSADNRLLVDRPRPLVLQSADDYPLICLNLWDSPERVVVVDATGKTISDFRLSSERGYHRGPFRVWAADIDGDGNDELLLPDRGHLMAIRPRDPGQPLWQYPVEHLWSDEIEGVLPASEFHGQLVVVRHIDAPGTVYALDARTGKPVWTVPAPSPQRDGQFFSSDRQNVALLSVTTAAHPPWMFVHKNLVSSVREARFIPLDEEEPPHSVAQMPQNTRAAPLLGNFAQDARRLRPLPWIVSGMGRSDLSTALAWAIFYSATLLYLPGAYGINLLVRRRFSLRRFLALPVVVALAMMGVIADSSDRLPGELTTRFLIAAFTLPALIAFVQIARWMLKRRWQLAGAWLAATVLASVVLAVLALVHAQFVSQTALQPDERYAWSGWYFIWLYGAYTVAWILTLSLLALVILKAAWRWLNRQRPSCVVTE